jgi:AraC-like DNA-binding protein
MGNVPSRALHQSFLPGGANARAHVWKFSWEYGGRRPRHFHVEPELNLIVAGSATFGIGEKVVKAGAGDLLGFPPGQDHVLLDTSPDVYLYAVGMAPLFSSEVLQSERHSVALPLHLRLKPSDFELLSARAAGIVDRCGVDQLVAELWERAYWLRQKQLSQLNSTMHVLTRRTLSLVAETPELGRAQLARILRATPNDISRYFHRDVGITLVQYRTRMRLLRFIHFVDHGGQSLTSAARAAGFGSYSQCHRVYQSELGCAPRQYFSSDLRQSMQDAYAL